MSTKLRAQVLHSLKWIAVGKAAAQTVRWLMTFWVIRLLSPEDYGYVAMADVAFGFFTLVLGSLFSPFLIQSKDLPESSLKHVFGMVLVVHFFLFAAQYLLSDLFGLYFQSAVVPDILKVTSVCFLFMALETIPNALLVRDMKFKKVSIIAAIANSVAAVATLALAYLGYGFWSLIFGEVICVVLRTVLTLLVQPISFLPTLSGTAFKPMFAFGGLLSVHSLFAYFFLHMDIAIAGRFMTAAEIGVFALSLQFALMPHKKIMPMLRTVAFPAFARIQDQPEVIRRYLTKAQRLCVLITVPIFWGVSAVADQLVPLALGEQWISAVIPTQLILIVMPLRFCQELFNPALKSQRRVVEMIYNLLTAILIMFIALTVGARFGATGLAAAWVLGFPVAFALILHRNARTFGMTSASIYKLFASPLLAGLLMIGAVHLVKLWLFEPSVTALAAQVTTGALAYIGTLFLIDRRAIREVLELRS